MAHSNNGSVVPSGTVRLLEGATPLGTAALNRQGEASWTLPAEQLAIGEHILHVSYSGDTFYDPVVSPVLIQQVTASKSATVTNLKHQFGCRGRKAAGAGYWRGYSAQWQGHASGSCVKPDILGNSCERRRDH